MTDLNTYFNSVSGLSRFPCSLGSLGGFVNFRNSGQRGGVKEFTLSLESILSGLKDIRSNLNEFASMSRYVESEWRDKGSNHFSDLILKSMITVQTKPCFTTFSKIINWATEKDVSEYDDNVIDLNIESLKTTIEKIEHLALSFSPNDHSINKRNENVVKHLDTQPIYKPFLLLAGISGTGKSRFVREQAKRSSGEDAPSNYELISVRPDWHEPSDLLGYVSRLGENAPHFVSTPTLKFVISAWKNINPTTEELSANRFHDKSGVLPYWLCLDEMNLAPVEQYFADYLSVIETREWTDSGYRCDSILKADVINGLSDKGKDALKKDLGLEEGFDTLWDYFTEQGIPIPYNLIVAGTVNMDETTHGFSRKVIDRALTVDFGEFFPNDFDAFFDGSQKQPIVLSYPTGSEAKEETDGAVKSRQFLKVLNESALKGTSFEVAFRALNELLLSVQSFAPYSDDDSAKLQAVWDDFLMMKVLPRIEGDRDKVEQVLEKLKEALTKQLNDIWLDEPKRLDLWRDTKDPILCRSKVKIKWMQDRLEKSGFTSFWP